MPNVKIVGKIDSLNSVLVTKYNIYGVGQFQVRVLSFKNVKANPRRSSDMINDRRQ